MEENMLSVLNVCLNRETKQSLIEKLLTIINDYNVDIEKYFVLGNETNTEVQEIFDFFNSFNIKKQRNCDNKTITAIKKLLKEFDKETIKKFIRRYNLVLNDTKYYFSYKWNVLEFFSRREGIWAFSDNGSKWLNYLSQRPIIDTETFFETIWKFYPNKNAKELARNEFDKKFIGIKNNEDAKAKANYIYKKMIKYIEDCDENYIKSFKNWLEGEIENGK